VAVIFTYNCCIIAEYKIQVRLYKLYWPISKYTDNNIMPILHPGSQYNLNN